MYYISLERSGYITSAGVCCIKIHEEMAEKSQVKYQSFIFTDPPVYMKAFFIFYL